MISIQQLGLSLASIQETAFLFTIQLIFTRSGFSTDTKDQQLIYEVIQTIQSVFKGFN